MVPSPGVSLWSRDKDWIIDSDVIIAEVSNPSLGVGYELGLSEAIGKPVLCLYHSANPKSLSAMVAGNKSFTTEIYSTMDDLKTIIDNFLNQN